MKKVLSLFAAALLMMACSNDDGDAGKGGTPITFNAEQVDFVTRAAGEIANGDDGMLNTRLGIFACYTGSQKYEMTTVTSDFMYNQEVWYDNTVSLWDYAPTKYWPNESADHVSFFAYAPYQGEPDGTKCIASFNGTTEQGDPYLVYKLAQQREQQVDLLYGVNADSGKPWFDLTKPDMGVDSRIKFKFYHALSCIGDVVTLKPSERLLTKLQGYATLTIDHIDISYDNLTSKARLSLNSTAGLPNWKAIVSGDLAATRLVTMEPAQATNYVADYQPTGTLGANGLTFQGFGLFYIPLQVAKDAQQATVTVYYRVNVNGNPAESYSGSTSSTFNLDVNPALAGQKQGIELTLTEDLDLLHLVYVVITDDQATEPSYSREMK